MCIRDRSHTEPHVNERSPIEKGKNEFVIRDDPMNRIESCNLIFYKGNVIPDPPNREWCKSLWCIVYRYIHTLTK